MWENTPVASRRKEKKRIWTENLETRKLHIIHISETHQNHCLCHPFKQFYILIFGFFIRLFGVQFTILSVLLCVISSVIMDKYIKQMCEHHREFHLDDMPRLYVCWDEHMTIEAQKFISHSQNDETNENGKLSKVNEAMWHPFHPLPTYIIKSLLVLHYHFMLHKRRELLSLPTSTLQANSAFHKNKWFWNRIWSYVFFFYLSLVYIVIEHFYLVSSCHSMRYSIKWISYMAMECNQFLVINDLCVVKL